ncbi:MAG: tyrosine-protein phosphatase [Gammaproteobacteria bacterium]
MSNEPLARAILFDGARNVRDLGGLPAHSGRTTRRGVIIRADGLSRLSRADLERLETLAVRTVIDLRYDEERARAPDRLPPGRPPRFLHRGLHPRGSVELFTQVNRGLADGARAHALMCDNYARIPFEHADAFGDILAELLRDDGAAFLIHCTSGKDRTGIAVALILGALGVPREVIVEDFELSNCEHQPVDVFTERARPDAIEVVMSAHGDFVRASLDAIDRRCGDLETYLDEWLGFGPAERTALALYMLD